ncbi:MAG: hypothetical protein K2X82_11720 [Gemmataceae bacterium]|nr:hypothetical protein [Gemmataceae bacterium]
MRPQFLIWTGGGPLDPEDGRRTEALADLPDLPDPEPLPRSALITHWWGYSRFEFAVVACSVRTTAWGDGRTTWLDYKGTQVTDAVPDGSATTKRFLVPAQYVTDVRPGPTYTITTRGTGGEIGLYPPNRPAPPHALPLSAVERGLAELSAAPADARGFSVSYPLFALRRPGGDYVGFGPDGDRPGPGGQFGIAVFTAEARAARFLKEFEGHQGRRGVRVEPFDRFAAFRRFLRSVRDSGAYVLFDPVRGRDGFVYADRAHPAAVVLERFLPQVAWGWSYPVYVLRAARPGLVLHTTEGLPDDGTRLPLVPVFTDADLADRALLLAPPAATVMAVPDAETFAQLLRDLPAGAAVAFDHEPAGSSVGKVVLMRDDLLANLEAMEL